MSTPVRSIFASKIGSPLSPALQNVTKVCKSPQFRNEAKVVRKSLNFQNSLVKNISPVHNKYLHLNNSQNTLNPTNIKIKVTDCCKELILNTPNKNKLSQEGPYFASNLKILGKGSFGTVTLGIYQGTKVAVKVIKLRSGSSIPKEKNALNLNHKNVIKIFDVILKTDANYGIVVMEYLKYTNHLQSILDDQNILLSSQTVIGYASDVCTGLQYCHTNAVLHLDIKPSNILVCEDNLCKLCDFGNSLRCSDTNQEKVYYGTAAYAAPELLLGKPPNSKCDIFSLGILLWQMRYRETPYSDLDAPEIIIYKVVKFGCRPTSPANICQQDDYYSIYTKCWATNPDNRPDISLVIRMLNGLKS